MNSFIIVLLGPVVSLDTCAEHHAMGPFAARRVQIFYCRWSGGTVFDGGPSTAELEEFYESDYLFVI